MGKKNRKVEKKTLDCPPAPDELLKACGISQDEFKAKFDKQVAKGSVMSLSDYLLPVVDSKSLSQIPKFANQRKSIQLHKMFLRMWKAHREVFSAHFTEFWLQLPSADLEEYLGQLAKSTCRVVCKAFNPTFQMIPSFAVRAWTAHLDTAMLVQKTRLLEAMEAHYRLLLDSKAQEAMPNSGATELVDDFDIPEPIWVVDTNSHFFLTLLDDFRENILTKERKMAKGLLKCWGCYNPSCTAEVSSSDLMKCSACASAWYCSRPCQRMHWKEHKQTCDPAEKQIEELEFERISSSSSSSSSSS